MTEEGKQLLNYRNTLFANEKRILRLFSRGVLYEL